MVETAPMALAFAFVAFDVVSGLIKAAAAHALSSKKMREGFWHKVASCFAILFSAFCASAAAVCEFIPDGFMAAYMLCCTYIISMETLSILENIGAVNPELPICKLLEIFGVEKDEKSN